MRPPGPLIGGLIALALAFAFPPAIARLAAQAEVDSARVRDTAETARALGHLADLGLFVDVAKDEDFAAVKDAPALRGVAGRLAANAQPLARGTVVATLPEADFFPEGMSHDSAAGVWYIGAFDAGR